ncbi:MAG: hypothetical protein ACP5KX_07930, partial [Caldisericia bacterium]
NRFAIFLLLFIILSLIFNFGLTGLKGENLIENDIKISGTIYEDINGDSYLSDGVKIQNVNIRLYKDNGNGIPDSSDSYLFGTNTNSNGFYQFSNLENGVYWILVDSKTISPSNGYNYGYNIGFIWAEQTYGGGGDWGGALWDDDGDSLTEPVIRNSPGPCYGGVYGDRSDGFNIGGSYDIEKAEHIAKVNIENNSISDIDFAFSFNIVVNVNDKDDDLNNQRTSQGSFRQFIQNANAILNENIMRFIPMVQKNMSGGGGGWWVITLNSSLPNITDNETQINGTAYNPDGSIRDDNPGELGTGGTVGIGPDGIPDTGDEHIFPKFKRLELEIDGKNSYSINLNSPFCSISNLALYRSTINLNANNCEVYNNLVGMRADGTTPLSTSFSYGIKLGNNVDNLKIHNNFVKINNSGIRRDGRGNNCIIENNEVDIPSNGQSSTYDGILLIVSSGISSKDIIRYNLTKNQRGAGIELGWNNGTLQNLDIYENSIIHNGYNLNGNPSSENLGVVIRNITSDSIINIYNNLIINNAGAGVVIQNSAKGVNIYENSFSNNLGLSIDFDPDSNDPNSSGGGDGVSPNNGTLNNNRGNFEIDYPIFNKAVVIRNDLYLEGYVGKPGQYITGEHKIEIYKAEDDGNNNGEIIEGDHENVPHGEGKYYLGYGITNNDGSFSFNISLPNSINLKNGDLITGTATYYNTTYNNYNTSEFSNNFPITIRDFGDAPNPYPTLLENNGAYHYIDQNIKLGSYIDAEVDGQPNATATGDDDEPLTGPDDEDGVTFTSPIIPGTNASVTVVAV